MLDTVTPLASSAELPIIRIHSGRRSLDQPIRELWNARELLYLLARRDVKLRYQHTIVGIGWAIVQPLFTMLVLLVFRHVANFAMDISVPYPLYLAVGLTLWTFLTHALTQSSNSLLNCEGVINKVYFPRLVLPLAAVLAAGFDLCAMLVLTPVLMIYFRVSPGPQLIALPAVLLLAIGLAAALGIWLSIINARFRDTANALPFVTQLWFFLTPIAYSPSTFSGHWRTLAALNPMLGIIEAFRWTLLGTHSPMLGTWVLMSVAITGILLGTGIRFFLNSEETLTDLF